MRWYSPPTGMVRRDNLLDALVAIWKTRYSISQKNDLDEFVQGYETGLEESLDAIAQAVGLSDAFEAEKTACRAKLKIRSNSGAKVVGVQAAIIVIDQ